MEISITNLKIISDALAIALPNLQDQSAIDKTKEALEIMSSIASIAKDMFLMEIKTLVEKVEKSPALEHSFMDYAKCLENVKAHLELFFTLEG